MSDISTSFCIQRSRPLLPITLSAGLKHLPLAKLRLTFIYRICLSTHFHQYLILFKILADRQQYFFISKKKIKKYFKKGYILNFEAGNKVSILSVSVDEFAIRSIFGSIRLSVVGSVITTVAAVSSFAFCKCITLNSTMYFKINRKLLCP